MQLDEDYLEQLSLRFLGDALATATKAYWERRAAVLDACRHRPGDWPGEATAATLAARNARLTADALECRRHAELFDHHDVDPGLIAEILGWPAVDNELETERRAA